MTRRQPVTRAQTALPGIVLHESAARAEALLRERARLLRDVNKKKQQVAQARTKAEQDVQVTVAKMGPLVERHGALVRELTSLFDELLAEGRLSARARKEVRKVRRVLELQGFLSPIGGPDEDEVGGAGHNPWDDDEPWADPRGGRAAAGKAGQRAQARGAAESSVREVASARQPGQERRTLRDIFRSLARAVHPDKAREDPERARRTEVMKELTLAYEQGDLARLLELESAWQTERVLAGEGDAEARCRELERINRELLNQVRQLTRELRDVKQSAREASFGPLDRVLEQAGRELDGFASICEFVRKFRDGKSTLAEFARGPVQLQGTDDDDIEGMLESVLMAELGYEPATVRPGSGRKRRRR